jgi:hypothetical protein
MYLVALEQEVIHTRALTMEGILSSAEKLAKERFEVTGLVEDGEVNQKYVEQQIRMVDNRPEGSTIPWDDTKYEDELEQRNKDEKDLIRRQKALLLQLSKDKDKEEKIALDRIRKETLDKKKEDKRIENARLEQKRHQLFIDKKLRKINK